MENLQEKDKNVSVLISQNRNKNIDILTQNYNKASSLNISYGEMQITISKEQKEYDNFIKILENAILSKGNQEKEAMVEKFFFANNNTQIECNCFNWVWSYVFEEFITYLELIKQLKDVYICEINKLNDFDLEHDISTLSLQFPKPNGLCLDVLGAINFIKENSNDGDIIIPEYVRNAKNIQGNEFFKIINLDNIDNMKGLVKSSINNSFLYAVDNANYQKNIGRQDIMDIIHNFKQIGVSNEDIDKIVRIIINSGVEDYCHLFRNIFNNFQTYTMSEETINLYNDFIDKIIFTQDIDNISYITIAQLLSYTTPTTYKLASLFNKYEERGYYAAMCELLYTFGYNLEFANIERCQQIFQKFFDNQDYSGAYTLLTRHCNIATLDNFTQLYNACEEGFIKNQIKIKIDKFSQG